MPKRIYKRSFKKKFHKKGGFRKAKMYKALHTQISRIKNSITETKFADSNLETSDIPAVTDPLTIY